MQQLQLPYKNFPIQEFSIEAIENADPPYTVFSKPTLCSMIL